MCLSCAVILVQSPLSVELKTEALELLMNLQKKKKRQKSAIEFIKHTGIQSHPVLPEKGLQRVEGLWSQ